MQIDYYYNLQTSKQKTTQLTKYIDFYVDYRKYEIKDTRERNLMLLSINGTVSLKS
jgi:hypothetical protein